MVDDVEIPDVQFWGLAVRSASPATYSIENVDGLMELCHVTNVALAHHEEGASGPIFVKVKSPEDGKSYTIGALLPGKQYSFSTDLMISPDTEFSVSGTNAEVHLTGYRSINAESVLIDDDDDEEDASDEEDSEDREFVVNGDAESDEEDESASGEEAMEEDLALTNGNALAARLSSEVHARHSKQRAMALTKRGLLSRLPGADDLEDDLDGDDDDDNDDDAGSSDAETSEDDDQESDPDARVREVAQAEAAAKKFNAEKALQAQRKVMDPEAEDEFEEAILGSDADESSDDDEDLAGPPEAVIVNDLTPKPKTKKGVAAGTEKAQAHTALKRQLEGETSRPAKKSKKITPESDVASPSGQAKAASAKPIPSHPDGASAETRDYVAKLVKYLREQGGSAKMSVIGVQCPRPPNADKLGKILKIYDSWFKKSGQKGQEDMLLQSKLR